MEKTLKITANKWYADNDDIPDLTECDSIENFRDIVEHAESIVPDDVHVTGIYEYLRNYTDFKD